jgi:hypothetical protein
VGPVVRIIHGVKGAFARVVVGNLACPRSPGWGWPGPNGAMHLFACMDEMSRVEDKLCSRPFWQPG